MKGLEDELRRVFRGKEREVPPVLPLSDYMDGHAAGHSRRWQWLVVPAAAAAAAAVVLGVVAIQPDAPADPPVAAEPVRHGPLVDTGATTDCIESYSPETVVERKFVFDGVVTEIGAGTTNRPDEGGLPLVAVTFAVKEWFVGGSQGTVTVDMAQPRATGGEDSSLAESYSVGTRLLVSGEPRWGGPDPLADAIAWDECGFVRYWDDQTATQWRAATSDFAAALNHDPCWETALASGTPDYGAPRPVEDTPPVQLAASWVDGASLSRAYPDASYVVAVTSDDSQKILLVNDDKIVGEFTYSYLEYGWESTGFAQCG